MDLGDYSKLRTASLTPEYLHSNATTHSFIFGAMAELVDNSRDAGADTLEIYVDEPKGASKSPLLCFLDNGCGMNPEEAINVGSFGASEKTSVADAIGMYGNGLKSGTMKLGQDMILFTKRNNELTCLMVSRTFYKNEGLKQVVIPAPTFNATTKAPVSKDKKKHGIELELLKKYSPFQDEQALYEQMSKLKGESGTLVICYNLFLDASGEYELDFKTDEDDIRTAVMTGEDTGVDVVEKKSFRAYVSILYKSPRMKIRLRGKKVRTRLLEYSLYKPSRIVVNYTNFKRQAEKRAKTKELELKDAVTRHGRLQGEVSRMGQNGDALVRNLQTRYRKLQMELTNSQKELDDKRIELENLKKECKGCHQLEFFFGLNIQERYHDGYFFYNADRLIKMYDREGTLQSKEEVTYKGIVAIISVPKSSLLPTHNKQEFADQQEFKKLKKTVDSAMKQYWCNLMNTLTKKGETILDLWKQMGYGQDWRKPPTDSGEAAERRIRHIPTLQQCDKCLRWRLIPYSKDSLNKKYPEIWECSMVPGDKTQNSCEKPQKLGKIPSETYLPPIASATDRLAQAKAQKDRAEKKFRKYGGDELPASQAKPGRTSSGKRVVATQNEQDTAEQELLEEQQEFDIWGGSMIAKSTSRRSSPPPLVRKSRKSLANNSKPAAAANDLIHSPAPKKKKKATNIPDSPPPIRIMRRPSPQRTTRAAEVTAKKTTVRSSSPRKSEPPVKRSRVIEISSSNPSTADERTDDDEPMAKPSTPKKVNVEKPKPTKNGCQPVEEKTYRFVTVQDLLNPGFVGMDVQGRLQGQWRDASILECRGTKALVRFSNKAKLELRVYEQSQRGTSEIRIQLKPGEEMITTNAHEASSTTTDDLLNLPPEARKIIDAHKTLIKGLNSQVDTDSMTFAQLSDLNITDFLLRHKGCVKQEAAEKEETRHAKALEKLRSDLKNTQVEALKKQQAKFEADMIAQAKKAEENNSKVVTEYQKKEGVKWKEIGGLFKDICAACVEEDTEADQDFDSYEGLRTVMKSIHSQLFNEDEAAGDDEQDTAS